MTLYVMGDWGIIHELLACLVNSSYVVGCGFELNFAEPLQNLIVAPQIKL